MNEVVALAFRHDPYQTPSIMPLSPSRLNILPVCFSAFCLCLTLLHGAPLRAQEFEVGSSGEESESIWDLQKAQTGGWLGSGFWGPNLVRDCWVWRLDDAGGSMWSYVHVESPAGGAMNDLIRHDALGNNVTSLIRQTGPRDFDVSRLPAGHYTVTIEGAKSSKASATLVKLQ